MTTRYQLPRWLALPISVACVVVLAACGGGSGPNVPAMTQTSAPVPVNTATPLQVTPSPVSPTSVPTNTPAPPPTATAIPPTPTLDPVVNNELSAVALALDDLPAGYIELPAEPAESATGPCGNPEFERKDNKIGEVEVRFQMSELGPFILQNLVVFPEEDAADAFAYARSAIDCTEWTETAADGAPTTYRVSPLELETFGDESFAIRVELDIENIGTLMTDSVFIRTGDVLSIVAYAMIDAPNLDSLAQLAETAAEKMADADVP